MSGGLTDEQRRRYARQLLLPEIGEEGQQRLLASRVLVVGAGGLGSPVLLYLAAAGVGTLGIVDDDLVDASNLQRQVIHHTRGVGRSKVAEAARRIAELNPDVRVVEHAVRLTDRNAAEIVAGYDVVVDGSDTFTTRYLVADTCERAGLPEVWGAVLRFDGLVSVFVPPDGPTYRDLHAGPPAGGSGPDDAPDDGPTCETAGVSGALCGVVGSLMAAEVIKLVTGRGRLLTGRVLVHDALNGTFREVPLGRDPRRPAPGAGSTASAAGDPSPTSPTSSTSSGAPTSPAAGSAIGDDTLRSLLAEDAVLLVDVRDAGERTARIAGSLPVPLEDFADPDVVARLIERAAGRRLVTVCPVGRRSAAAARVLRAAGAPDAVHLDGGVLAWLTTPH